MYHRTLSFLLAVIVTCLFAIPASATSFGNPLQKPLRILAFGDSLTAGYNLSRNEAFPAALQRALSEAGYKTEIYNAGISGDTTTSGLKRLDTTLQKFPKPDLVILALGANDMLRRIEPKVTDKNLRDIIDYFKTQDIPVFLIGMQAVVHPSPIFRFKFNRIYPRLAKHYDIALMPFFLEGVAMNPSMNIEDGIHPNTRGIALMVENTLPYLTPVLDGILQK